jgi:DNA-binding CsgD family transcriptional regulator
MIMFPDWMFLFVLIPIPPILLHVHSWYSSRCVVFIQRNGGPPIALKGGFDVIISTSKKTERHDLPRRIADRALHDLYKTFSTPYCHSCLERTAYAVLLLDSERGVMYVTSQADQIMSRSSISFTLIPKFTLPPSHNAVRFANFVNGKNTEAGPLLLLLTGEKNQDMLLLTCFRLPEPAIPDLHAARFLVALRDPNHYPVRQWHFFSEQFNLTQAEARLCRAVADGLTLSDYCANWRVTISTARSQLGSVFAKTDTRRQSDLLRLIYLFTRV